MHALFRHAGDILSSYTGEIPLHHILKAHFRKFPILGSRDRKCISALVYSHYRCALLLSNEVEAPKRWWASMVLSDQSRSLISLLFPDFPLPPEQSNWLERSRFLHEQGIGHQPQALLNNLPDFSETLTPEVYCSAFFSQPALFIKASPSALGRIQKILSKQGISFTDHGQSCLELPLNTPLQQWLKPADFRVQDRASQAVYQHFPNFQPKLIWDVCAGAGGKTLLLRERYAKAELMASDVRETALANLRQRFMQYGYTPPWMAVFDAASGEEPSFIDEKQQPDLVVCDVPCSGSGTWHRNPEQRFFFQPETLEQTTERQFQIAASAAKTLAPEGYLLYITCSVFKAENEGVVERLQNDTSLKLEHQQLISFLHAGGDSLYVALFKNEA